MNSVVTSATGRRRRHPVTGLAATVAVAALVLAACSDIDQPNQAGDPAGEGLAACPDPIVIQSPWWPQSEHGHLYQMLDKENYTVDAGAKKVTGPLLDAGQETGATIEIRAGGPAIGFDLSISLMHTDDSITLAGAHTDDQVARYAETPVLAVMAPLELHPRIIMWDPESHPEWSTIVDIGESDATVLYFENSYYMDWLIGNGILRQDQVDASYDGNPDRFVAEDGAVALQGYATNEPYLYQHEVEQWGKPVTSELIHNRGYEMYADALTIRADRRDELAPCLTELIPIIQRAMVDYVADPGPTNELIVGLSTEYGGYTYTAGNAEFGVTEALRLGIIGNGGNDTIGDFDEVRVADALDEVRPIMTGQNVDVPEDLSAEDLVTNEFIDTTIGIPSSS
jgi:hypothetical protein